MIHPAFLSVPPRVGSYGDEAIDLAERAGRVLDEEQQLAVDALLSYGPGGRWAAMESAVIESRQNGKTAGVLLPVTLFDLFLMEPDRIVWTAHLFRTSRDAFEDFDACIATSPDLSRRVKRICYGHGEEAVELHNGAKLEFLARSKGGGRGLGGKRVVMDEALFIAASAMGALMPTLSARQDPQINYGSSGALDTSDHLHRLKDRGRTGKDPSLIWVEWCAPGGWEDPPCATGPKCSHMPGTAGCALDDEEMWAKANHTLGKRITVPYVRAERLALPPLEFGRERLGWHQPSAAGGAVIDPGAWANLLDATTKREGDVALGVDISPDRTYAAIGIYGKRPDGFGHMQVITYKPGVDWVPGAIVKWKDALNPVAIAMGRGTAASLEVELKKVGIARPEDPDFPQRGDLAVLNALEMSAGCGLILDGVRQGADKHAPDPANALDSSAAGVKVKQNGDVLVWARKESTADTSPVVSVTVAKQAYTALAHLIDEEEPDPCVVFV